MTRILSAGYALLLAILFANSFGCSSGQPSGRPDIDAIPDEELHGASTKAMLYEFRAKVKKRGVKAAKDELPVLLESFEGLEKRPVGQHLDTYKQIAEKLQALNGTLAGNPSADAVTKAANEIGALADKLPGKADPNPLVE
jgi:hypothetical protein